MFVDEGAVGGDGGFAGDGGPFAGGVEEGDVDVGIGFEVVCFAGFGVGVEEEVDATGFLEKGVSGVEREGGGDGMYLGGQGHAS